LYEEDQPLFQRVVVAGVNVTVANCCQSGGDVVEAFKVDAEEAFILVAVLDYLLDSPFEPAFFVLPNPDPEAGDQVNRVEHRDHQLQHVDDIFNRGAIGQEVVLDTVGYQFNACVDSRHHHNLKEMKREKHLINSRSD
jgi:hypothetical protein